MRWAALVAGYALALVSCAELPSIESGECGNGIKDRGEDCDVFAANHLSVCRAPGTVGECHLDCTPDRDGDHPPCPQGWGCSIDRICRPPTGQFDARVELEHGSGYSLLAGDFDGDRRSDVVSIEPTDTVGNTRLRIHFFDETAALAETRVFPKTLLSPVVSDVSGDGRSDLIFSDSRLGLLLGRADRTLVPETFGSYRIPTAKSRLVAVSDRMIAGAPAIAVVTTLDDGPGLYVLNSAGQGSLRLLSELAGGAEQLVGDPVAGDVIEDPTSSPCSEVVLATRAEPGFRLVNLCTRTDKGVLAWRAVAERRVIALEPIEEVTASPQLTDMNADGHLDVLLGTRAGPYVAYGDGSGLATATPLETGLPAELASEIGDPLPLAAADFTGDGAVDFVFDDRVIVSRPSFSGGPPEYALGALNSGARWTEVRIADLNGNGHLDVIAASQELPIIDFFNGSGTDQLAHFRLSTSRPARQLVVGDFDGDLVDDLAFAEPSPATLQPDSVMIAFGNPAGPPAAGIAVARVQNVEQLVDAADNGVGSLFVVSTDSADGRRDGVVTLLLGSGDRVPFAPYELTRFSTEGALRSSSALSLTAGAFSAAGARDALAFASPDLERTWELWSLPGVASSQSLIAERRPETFDETVLPAVANNQHLEVAISSAALDLDGDDIDEALFVMPDTTGRCVVVVVTQEGPRALGAASPGALLLDEPCMRPELAPADVDGDGALDLVLLSGAPGGDDRKLLVLWNDAGVLGASPALVSEPGDSPRQFAVLPRTPTRNFSLAYITDNAVKLVSTTSKRRELKAQDPLTSVEHGTGIVAADVNGDGVTDLALLASGALTVLTAALEQP